MTGSEYEWILLPNSITLLRYRDARRGGRDGILSHCCDAIAILYVAGTAPMALAGEYVPSLDVRKSCMSLAPQPFDSIPEETIRVARAAFPHSTRLMQMR